MRHAAQHLSPWRTCDGMGLDPSSRPMPSRNPGLEELGSSIATTDSLRRRRQLEVPDTGEHRVYPVAPDRLAYSEPETGSVCRVGFCEWIFGGRRRRRQRRRALPVPAGEREHNKILLVRDNVIPKDAVVCVEPQY